MSRLFFTRAYKFAGAALPPLARDAWVFLALPLAVCISLIISVGAELQHSVFSALNGRAPNIYSAAFGDALTQYPAFLDWILGGLHWFWLLAGTAIVVIALHARKVRHFLPAVAGATAGILTAIDFGTAAIARDFVITDQLTNVTANILGGSLIGALIGIALLAYRYVRHALHDSRRFALIAAAITLVLFGLLTSTLTFLSLRLLYDPLPARISLELSTPASGYFSFSRRSEAESNSDQLPDDSFDFLPRDTTSGAAEITYAHGRILADWQRAEATTEFNADVRFVSDCVFREIAEMPLGPPQISLHNVRHVSVRVDEGIGDLKVAEGASRTFRLEQENVNSYRVETQDEATNVSFFTQEADRLLLTDREGMTFFVGAHLASPNQTTMSSRPRTVTLEIDGRQWPVTFSNNVEWQRSRALNCQSLPAQSIPTNAGPLTIDANSAVHAGVLITLEPRGTDETIYVNDRNTLAIGGASGWMMVSKLPSQSMEQPSTGYLSAIIAHGNASDFRSDGSPVEMRAYDAAVLLGNFSAGFNAGGGVHVSGSANQAWRNDERLNHTQWENLSAEWKISLIAAFLTVVGFLARWTWRGVVRHRHEEIDVWVRG